jgi:hypothetical protein
MPSNDQMTKPKAAVGLPSKIVPEIKDVNNSLPYLSRNILVIIATGLFQQFSSNTQCHFLLPLATVALG